MIDLFEVCVPKEKMHKNFINILEEKSDIARKYISSWTEGFIDRDGKLRIEFQTTFNSTFWELYLYNVMKKWSFTISFDHQYPDFIIQKPYEICIEAVTASNAIDEKAEWERDYKKFLDGKVDIEEVVRIATIRLANALISKYRKFKEHYSNSPQVKRKPFIIAVAPFEQPFFWEQTQRAIGQVLYGYKRTIYEDIESENRRIYLGQEYISSITKDNGADIPLGFFSENMMPEISAVIFSNVATMGKVRAMIKDNDDRDMIFSYAKYNKYGLKPIIKSCSKAEYQEELEDGLGIFLNPYANYEIPKDVVELFPNMTEYDVDQQIVLGNGKNGDLLNRMVTVINIQE